MAVTRGTLTLKDNSSPSTRAVPAHRPKPRRTFATSANRRSRRASRVAAALNSARRRRGESLAQASRRSGLPVRYLAAFELDAAHRLFRGAGYAAAFLGEYARYLGLPAERTVDRFLAGYGLHRPSPPRPRAAGVGKHRRAIPSISSRQRGRMATLAAVGALSVSMGVVALVRPGPLPAVGPGLAVGQTLGSPGPELPRGGRTLFPDYRVVAMYGSPIDDRMGRLGQGPPSFAGARLLAQAAEYEIGDRPVMPALEIVSTVATSHPSRDGTYTLRLPDSTLQAYLAQARAVKGLLILDVQSGRGSFVEEFKRYEHLLRHPDVGLALDPEWRVGPTGVPGQGVGTVDAAEVNQVVDLMADLVRRHDLPQKILIIHQFNQAMVTDRLAIRTPPEVAVTFDFDGMGSPVAKAHTYTNLGLGLGTAKGIKLHYDLEPDLMSPRDVLDLQPPPDLIIYQ